MKDCAERFFKKSSLIKLFLLQVDNFEKKSYCGYFTYNAKQSRVFRYHPLLVLLLKHD